MGMFKHCKDCALGKAKKSGVSKKSMTQSKILGPLTPTFGGEKDWLLLMEDISDYSWNNFFKRKVRIEKSNVGLN